MKIRELPKVIVGRTQEQGKCRWCKRKTNEVRTMGGHELGRCCSNACAETVSRWLPLPLEAA